MCGVGRYEISRWLSELKESIVIFVRPSVFAAEECKVQRG